MPEPEEEEVGGLPTDIDSMFEDDDDEEIETFQSLIGDDDDGDGMDEIDSPDEMEDPDYIPEVFSADEQEPDDDAPRKSPILKIIGMVFVLLIVGLIAAAFFLKETVVKFVPELNAVYDMIGFTQVGAGLQIQNVQNEQELDAGVEVLAVRGRIENVSDKVRPVPMLRAILYDGEEEEIQTQDVAPFKSTLKASEKLSFKIRIKDPSPLRRRVKVIFIKPEDAKPQ